MTRDEVRRRRERALNLFTGGMSHQAIAALEARDSGKPPRRASAVAQDIALLLQERQVQPTEERAERISLEIERLDYIHRTAQTTIQTQQSGRCRSCGRVDDPGAVTRAGQLMLRAMERRAALLGLDASMGVEKPPSADPVDVLRNAVGNTSNVTVGDFGPRKRGPRKGSGL